MYSTSILNFTKGIHLQTPSAYDKIEIQIPTMMTLKEITIKA